MSGDYIFPDEVVPSAAPPAPSKIEKTLKRIVCIIILALGMELIWFWGITPFMPLSSVEISGYQGVAREQVLSQAGIGPQSSYISVDSRTVERALRALYQVESARVVKHFPDRVVIFLEGRKAAAISLANFDGRVVPLFFDREGVVFRIGSDGLSPANLLALSPALPVISGLVIDEPILGMRLPPLFSSLFARLEQIEASAPNLLSAISEIRINRRSFDGFDLIIYPVHNRVKVRLGPELSEDLLRYTLLMVDVLVSRDPGIDEIDFRAGMASYTVKEGSPE